MIGLALSVCAVRALVVFHVSHAVVVIVSCSRARIARRPASCDGCCRCCSAVKAHTGMHATRNCFFVISVKATTVPDTSVGRGSCLALSCPNR